MVGHPVHQRPCRAALLLGLSVLIGCSRTAPPPASATNTASAGRTTPAALVTSPQQNALAVVQAHPLYRQAQQACKLRDFRAAADLLSQLTASASLSAEQLAFVEEQRNLCLHDAGLPEEGKREKETGKRETSSLPTPNTQHPTPSSADCGPRALLLACEQLGVKATLPQLRQLAGTTEQGSSVEGLAQAAKAVGLQAEGVQVSREALPDVDMPALAYVNGNHFVLVLEVQGRGEGATARIHDPNHAQKETISQERLLRLCSGYLLLLHR